MTPERTGYTYNDFEASLPHSLESLYLCGREALESQVIIRVWDRGCGIEGVG